MDIAFNKYYVRPLLPDDFQQLKEAHKELFPVDYEDKFFFKACRNIANIFSVAFFSDPDKTHLIAFVTARALLTEDVNILDRKRLGLSNPRFNKMKVAYILTIGVIPSYQRRGIGSYLTEELEREAARQNVRVLYLHVITYNNSAINLYKKYNYECKAFIKNFYNIYTGRQPDSNRIKWDAYFFMKWTYDNNDCSDESISDYAEEDMIGSIFSSLKFCWPFSASYIFLLVNAFIFALFIMVYLDILIFQQEIHPISLYLIDFSIDGQKEKAQATSPWSIIYDERQHNFDYFNNTIHLLH